LNTEDIKRVRNALGKAFSKDDLFELIYLDIPVSQQNEDESSNRFFPPGLFLNTQPLVNQDTIKFAMEGMIASQGNGPAPILINGNRYTGKSYSYHYLRHLAIQSNSNVAKIDMRKFRNSEPEEKFYKFVAKLFSKAKLNTPEVNFCEQPARAANAYCETLRSDIGQSEVAITLFIDHFEPENRPIGSIEFLVGIIRLILDGDISKLNLVVSGLKKDELESDVRGEVEEWSSETLNQNHLVSYFCRCFNEVNVDIPKSSIEQICGNIFTNLPSDPLEKMEAVKTRSIKKYVEVVSSIQG